MKLKVELTFPTKLKDEPIIYYLSKRFDLEFNIIEASFSTEIGWAYLIFRGKKENLEKAFSYLKKKRVTINRIEKL